jgi:hypothetical protein
MLNVQKTIEKFRDYVIRESKDNLKRGGQYGSYNNTSALSNSLKGEIVTENGFTIVGFKMADYGAYRDQGVKGKTSSNKAPNSPFKFGSGTGRKGGLTEGIKKWVKQKGFQFRSKEEGSKGRFLSYDSTAYLITRSIFHKGIKPSLFFTKPFEEGYKKYIDVDLLKAFGQDIETMVDYNLKDIK